MKLKTLISNEDNFKNSSDWFFFKTFIELFKKTFKDSKWHKCSKWSFNKLIINSIDPEGKSFSKSENDNRSNDQSKESIMKLANKN